MWNWIDSLYNLPAFPCCNIKEVARKKKKKKNLPLHIGHKHKYLISSSHPVYERLQCIYSLVLSSYVVLCK